MRRFFVLNAVASFLFTDIIEVVVTDAFPLFPLSASRRPHISHRSVSRICLHSGHAFDDHDDYFDVEAARRELEALVGGGHSADQSTMMPDQKKRTYSPATSSSSSSSSRSASSLLPPTPTLDVMLPPPPPLTTIERERRLAEIELLSHLTHGDEKLSDIWNLWFSERGPTAAAKLRKADHLMNEDPRFWQEAGDILRELIDEYGVYFVEPLNRLATLYHLQGRLEDALTLCKIILSVKPWHFGALSGIVLNYAGLHDSERARQWAARRLPNFASMGPNKRRRQWVEQAVLDASTALKEAEQRNVNVFGRPDSHVTTISLESNGDSWQ